MYYFILDNLKYVFQVHGETGREGKQTKRDKGMQKNKKTIRASLEFLFVCFLTSGSWAFLNTVGVKKRFTTVQGGHKGRFFSSFFTFKTSMCLTDTVERERSKQKKNKLQTFRVFFWNFLFVYA